jgi:hypothetical protein
MLGPADWTESGSRMPNDAGLPIGKPVKGSDPWPRRRERWALHRAVREGRLPMPTRCGACGASTPYPDLRGERLQDGSVIWVCRRCR